MIYAIAAALVLVLDQAVKFWTTKNIIPGATGADCVQLIPGVLHMTNIHNTGAAFSILRDSRWLLVAVSVVFIIAILVLISQEIIHTKFGKWTSVLVMAGAAGNCVDRIIYGFVVDMFEVELFNFAVFNVADIFITVCGILFCIHVILYRDPAAEAQGAGAGRQKGRARAVEEPEEEIPARRGRRRAAATAEDEDKPEEAPARRGRKAKTPKEDPYAAIPHRERSAHRSLEEEMRPADPEDPFAEWSFNSEEEDNPFVEVDAAPKRRRRADPFMDGEDAYVEEERPAPRRQRKAEPAAEASQAAPVIETEPIPRRNKKIAPTVAEPTAADDDWSAAVDLDKIMANRAKNRPVVDAPTRRMEKAPADPEKPAPAAEPSDDGEYSLEDILNEFGNFDI